MAKLPPKYSRVYEYTNRSMLQFADALCPYLKRLGCTGSGGGVVEVTLSELNTLINNANLSPGTLYKVTGVNKNKPNGGPTNPDGYLPEILYDDGNNLGITVYAFALSTTEMSSTGWGEFYNPKYIDGNSYNNTDGTGLYGIWDGNNPDPLQVPVYQIGDVVFWGGYAWQNISGLVGNSFNQYVLIENTDWVKLPYSNTNYYEKVIDPIDIDWSNDLIIGRYNPENQIEVTFSSPAVSWWNGLLVDNRSPIAAFGWGLYSKVLSGIDFLFYGISGVHAKDSLIETVNFKSVGFINVQSNASFIYNNYWGKDSYFDECAFDAFPSINNSTFVNAQIYSNWWHDAYTSVISLTNSNFINNYIESSNIIQLQADDYSYIQNNSIVNGNISQLTMSSSIFSYNTMFNSVINSSIILNGAIQNNTVSQGGSISNNTLNNSNISYNTVSGVQAQINVNNLTVGSAIAYNVVNSEANINSNTLTFSSAISGNNLSGFITKISNNTMQASVIDRNSLDSSSQITLFTLVGNSRITGNTLSNTVIENVSFDDNQLAYCTFINTYFSPNQFGKSKYFLDIDFQGPLYIVESFTGATHIFYDCSKRIYRRKDGNKRLSYFDNSDTPTIVNINA